MNLNTRLEQLKAKAAVLEAKIERDTARKLSRLPRLGGYATIHELIIALQRFERRGTTKSGRRSSGKRIHLPSEVKEKLIAEALKPGADKRALAKKYGANLNSLRVWVAFAKRPAKAAK
jgi:transposase-like protein